MPLKILIPEKEFYDAEKNEFIFVKETVLKLEHSLISISNWESKWHKPYLSKEEKTKEEVIDYIKCMTLNSDVNPIVYQCLSEKNLNDIIDYIKNPMTATTINNKDKKISREIITNELIYYWMSELGIPFDPCQKWHLNRLFTLIEVCAIKKQPPKKMSKKDIMRRNSALNAQRRARHHTRG